MTREEVHGEELVFPTPAELAQISRSGVLEGRPVPFPEYIDWWLEEQSEFRVAELALRLLHGWWSLVPLLNLGGHRYRVHFEDVVCQHCARRCGPSAKPDTPLYGGSGYSQQQVWEDFERLPVKACPHCGGRLSKRGTVWLAADE